MDEFDEAYEQYRKRPPDLSGGGGARLVSDGRDWQAAPWLVVEVPPTWADRWTA